MVPKGTLSKARTKESSFSKEVDIFLENLRENGEFEHTRAFTAPEDIENKSLFSRKTTENRSSITIKGLRIREARKIAICERATCSFSTQISLDWEVSSARLPRSKATHPIHQTTEQASLMIGEEE